MHVRKVPLDKHGTAFLRGGHELLPRKNHHGYPQWPHRLARTLQPEPAAMQRHIKTAARAAPLF